MGNQPRSSDDRAGKLNSFIGKSRYENVRFISQYCCARLFPSEANKGKEKRKNPTAGIVPVKVTDENFTASTPESQTFTPSIPND